MAIRPLSDDNTKFQIDFYPQGKKGERVRITFYGSWLEAAQLERDLRQTHMCAVSINPRISEAVPAWLKECENNLAKNTVTDIKKCLKNLNFFLPYRFTVLTPAIVEDYKKFRLAGGVKARTVNKELSYFSGLTKSAVKNKFCNPLPFTIGLIPDSACPQPDILTVEEVSDLIDKLDEVYLCILLLLLDAALRRNEALTLTAEKVNLPANTFQVLGKNGKYDTLPISTERLRLALENAVNDVGGTGYLFINPQTGKPFTSIRKALRRAAKDAGIKKRVYHHLLRHCFGTHGVESGINIRVMQKLMRHSTVKVTERYTQISAKLLESETRKYAAVAERKKGPMQKVVGGKRYDTEKSEIIATRCNNLMVVDPSYIDEKLYRTPNGNWFILGEGGAHTRFSSEGGLGRNILPLNGTEAQTWLEQYSSIETVERYFSDGIEDA